MPRSPRACRAQHDGPVTGPTLDASTETAASRRFSVVLNTAGVAIVGFFLVRQGLLSQPAWVVVLTGVALLAWLLRSLTLGSTSANPAVAGSDPAARGSRWELAGTV